MIFSGGFVREGGGGTGTWDPCPQTQDHWAHTLDGACIDGERLFSTQPTQPTYVCVDVDDEELGPDLTRDDDAKKKGRDTGPPASPTTRTNVCATRGSQPAMSA
jgi:hypothetical protein